MTFKSYAPLFGIILLSLFSITPAFAQTADSQQIMRILHMLDYIGVDYPEFVKNGEVLNPAEFTEQVEFAREVDERIAQLPATENQAALQQAAKKLRASINAKSAGSQVAASTTQLSQQLRRAYPVTEAPRAAPNVQAAAQLFQDNCSACHGVTGMGDGAAGIGMEPGPTNFLDAERQRQRSVFGLHNIITLGVDGTGMPSFAHLADEQRWALAFYVGQMIYSEADRSAGADLWQDGETAGISDLQALTTSLPKELSRDFGAAGNQLSAYLRAHPEVLNTGKDPLAIASSKLDASLNAYGQGDGKTALQLALDAYLEGFELAEPALAALDKPLMRDIEADMLELRQQIKSEQPQEVVELQISSIQTKLTQAQQRLAGDGLDATGSFLGSYIILTREGLEAILLLAAMLAFLSKTERNSARKYVHAGWIAALAMGGVTWYAASHLINISGASREMTEGVSALVAAAVLLSVGLWLHNKSYASRWQSYVSTRIGQALSGTGLWGLAALAFIATYREVFETVLFYQALWSQGEHNAILWGFGAAVITLMVVAIALFYFSMKLPIRQFFSASAVFIVALAVIFTGKGVAALQEAGSLPINSVDFVSVPMLGIYPSLQVLLFQTLVLMIVLGGFAWNHLTVKRATA